jgi:hypothetical protein
MKNMAEKENIIAANTPPKCDVTNMALGSDSIVAHVIFS